MVVGNKVSPCGNIVCSFVILKPPSFFCPVNLDLVIDTGVALRDWTRKKEGFNRADKDHGANQPGQSKSQLLAHNARDA